MVGGLKGRWVVLVGGAGLDGVHVELCVGQETPVAGDGGSRGFGEDRMKWSGRCRIFLR